MIKNKKIFITGGAGFIANKLIERVITNNQIIVYDNFIRDTLSKSKFCKHKNIKIIRGDVLDYDNLKKSMEGSDIVVHAAAIAGIDTVIKKPTNTMRVNMIGTANTLEAAQQNKVEDRFIDFSTSEVFGTMAYKSTEEDKSSIGEAGVARWSYAVSKLAGEHLSLAYHNEFGLPVVSVRPFNVYGPGQMGEGALIIFVKKALKNEDIFIYGDGSAIRAWCYVDDFIEGLMKCLEIPEAIGNTFNIGNSRTVFTTYGLAQTVCRTLNSKSKTVFKPALSADIQLRIPSVDKAQKVLNFCANTEIEDGIRKTAEWVKKNNDKG